MHIQPCICTQPCNVLIVGVVGLRSKPDYHTQEYCFAASINHNCYLASIDHGSSCMTYRHSLGITFVQHKYTSVSYNTVTIHSLSVLLQGLTEAVTTYAPQVSALAGTSFSMCPLFHTAHSLLQLTQYLSV